MIRFGKNLLSLRQPLSFNAKSYNKPLVTVAPVITGVAAVGEVLTYVPGTWLNFSSITHTWFSDGVFVKFSGPTYTVEASDAGKTITVLEQATNASGGASSRSRGVSIP